MAKNLDDIKILPDPYIHHPESGSYEVDDWQSETTSVASDLYRGFLENGRRYQSLRNAEYFSPADEQQFETYEVGHLAALLMNSDKANPLYCAPIKEPKHVLDVGTGQGAWAIDVADMFPKALVRGVDLFPPPNSWIPPNCVFEVDDVLQEWTWREKFDLVHLRHGIGAFSPDEWAVLYKQCYENLEPGGWFEQIEMDIRCECDDESIPADSILLTWGLRFFAAGEKLGKSLDITKTMRTSIKEAGFVEIHEETKKWPIGPWPRDKTLKDAGMVNLQHWLAGMEGYSMHLLTRYGDPAPWSKEEVLVYVAQMRKALGNPHIHAFQRAKRVWARKPFPDEQASKTKS